MIAYKHIIDLYTSNIAMIKGLEVICYGRKHDKMDTIVFEIKYKSNIYEVILRDYLPNNDLSIHIRREVNNEYVNVLQIIKPSDVKYVVKVFEDTLNQIEELIKEKEINERRNYI